MYKSIKNSNLGIICLVLWLILPAQSYSTDSKVMDESINLVMRKVADQLLRSKGDSSSQIPPVEQMDNLFSLKIETDFNYGDLPKLLDQALLAANIQRDYHLVVRNCNPAQNAILGYRRQDFINGQIPCRGREQQANCNIIELRILDQITQELVNTPMVKQSNDSNAWMLIPLISIAILIASGLFLFKRKRSSEPSSPQEEEFESAEEPTEEPINGVILGSFIFDAQNQILIKGTEEQNLTFREAKILKIFADQPNQIVTRDTLIDEVWGKEGVIVGRSLDVFISRLRKLLKPDEAVNITNIHGVGYKLEVAKN